MQEALAVALRALEAADRSRAELDARLQRKGLSEAERLEALAELERLGYLDDARTALTRAERLAERGYGNGHIRADLSARGLPAEEAVAALAPESERVPRFAHRGAAWLARRGFDRDAIETLQATGPERYDG